MKARSHAAAGITRSISEPVYAKDILSDMDLNLCSLSTYGAWMMTLLYLWDGKIDRLSHTVKDWAKLWRCSPSQAQVCIFELTEKSVCRVEIATSDGTIDAQTCINNFHETVGNNRVTLVSRRLERRLISRNQSTTRVQRHRQRRCNAVGNIKKPTLSPSVSISPSASAKGEEQSPPVSEPPWARKKAAKEELDRLRGKAHPTDHEQKRMVELRRIISECNNAIAGAPKS